LPRAARPTIPRLVVTFPVPVPANFTDDEITEPAQSPGLHPHPFARRVPTATSACHAGPLSPRQAERSRIAEAVEAALGRGKGRLAVRAVRDDGETVWRFSRDLHCADCDIHYGDPTPGLFSFNSPIGACDTCRGFGRVIGVDFGLVVPDESKTLAEGAVKPWQTASLSECQDDLAKMAKKYGVAMDIPVRDLPPEHRHWLLEGDDTWKSWESSWPRKWYGVRRFFEWLETKAYKMHIRVLLSRYRSYTECPSCHGARLKPEALLWRLGGSRGSSVVGCAAPGAGSIRLLRCGAEASPRSTPHPGRNRHAGTTERKTIDALGVGTNASGRAEAHMPIRSPTTVATDAGGAGLRPLPRSERSPAPPVPVADTSTNASSTTPHPHKQQRLRNQ
jgi:excinuclease ABC subunit A